MVKSRNIFLFVTCASFIWADLSFKNISVKNGLSENYCNVVSRDGLGFVWIGTDEGLNRYDGYIPVIYRSNPFDSTALSGNRIYNIFKDASGEVWIATDKSLDKYIHGNNEFRRYTTKSRPTFVTEDNNGIVWVGTIDDGLFEIDKKTGKTTNHRFSPLDPLSISSNSFSPSQKTPIVFDEDNNVWVGTNNGLNFFNRKTKTFRRFFPQDDDNSISSKKINTLHIDGDYLWVGTASGLDQVNTKTMEIQRLAGSKWFSIMGHHNVIQIVPFKKGTPMEGFWMATTSGLVYFDKNMDTFQDIIHEKIFGRYVSNIFPDKEGNLALLIPQSSGMVYFKTTNFYIMYGFIDAASDIYHNVSKEEDERTLSSNKIKHVYFDDENTAWVSSEEGVDRQITTKDVFLVEKSGNLQKKHIQSIDVYRAMNEIWFSHNEGVTAINKKTNTTTTYTSDPTDVNSLLSRESGALKVLKSGEVWVASVYGGVSVIGADRKTITRYTDEGVEGDIIGGKINTIFQSSDGRVYLSSSKGTSIFKGKTFKNSLYNQTIKNSQVSDVNVFFEDKQGGFWVGTNTNGLFKINKDDLSVLEQYKLDPNNPKSFASSTVYDILETKEGALLFGTGGEGLFLYNKNENNFDRLTYKDGLPSNTVVSLIEDKQGDIWAGTRNGSSKINIKTGQIQNYNISDGLTDRALSVGASVASNYGKIYFGGPSGVSYTDPLSIAINQVPPKLSIVEVASIDGSNNRSKVDFATDSIRIYHDTQTLEIDFVGLSFIKSEKNQYKYFLENYNNTWVDNGTNKKTFFQGLKPGEYKFSFMASNNDGLWSEASRPLHIKVYPPVWKTWWAYSSYAGVLLLAVFGSVRRYDSVQVKKIEQDRRETELEEAREFQMKMLPKDPPKMLGLEIAAGIKTATEVGGDYYDWFPQNNSLYVAVGDATGHGMTAGMMVSITKAGLMGTPPHIPPNEVTYGLNRTIKSIDLGKNKMAISIARFWEDRVEFTSAAMPPIYHYKSETNEVDEILLEGLPLGSFKGETYSLLSVETKPGDAYVFISDGLPEATNISEKMLGYKAVLECIKNNGKNSAEEIKQTLFDLGNAWLDGVPNQDDITIVVVKKN